MAPLKELPPDHDIAHLEAALSFCDSYRTAIDGGAHRGHWTRRLRTHFERVVAFEPHPDNFRALSNVGGVMSVCAALGDQSGRCGIEPGPENTGQYHVAEGSMVPMRTVDEYGPREVDLLKLDVEGYELFALRGAEKTITRDRPVVLIEENGLCERYGVAPGAAGEWLGDHGYIRARRLNKDEIWVPDDRDR